MQLRYDEDFIDGEKTRARSGGVVDVSLARRHVDAAGCGHGEDTIGSIRGGDSQLTARDTERNATRQDETN